MNKAFEEFVVKHRKVVLIGSGVVVAGTLAVIIINNANTAKKQAAVMAVINGSGSGSQNDLTTPQIQALGDNTFPINTGDSGTQVGLLQQALNKKYNAGLQVTGTYDDTTAQAVCKYYSPLCSTYWQSATMGGWGQFSSLAQTDWNAIVNTASTFDGTTPSTWNPLWFLGAALAVVVVGGIVIGRSKK